MASYGSQWITHLPAPRVEWDGEVIFEGHAPMWTLGTDAQSNTFHQHLQGQVAYQVALGNYNRGLGALGGLGGAVGGAMTGLADAQREVNQFNAAIMEQMRQMQNDVARQLRDQLNAQLFQQGQQWQPYPQTGAMPGEIIEGPAPEPTRLQQTVTWWRNWRNR
jgi:hypothetical protein